MGWISSSRFSSPCPLLFYLTQQLPRVRPGAEHDRTTGESDTSSVFEELSLLGQLHRTLGEGAVDREHSV